MKRLVLPAILILGLVSSLPVRAQEQEPAESDQVITVDVDLVNVLFTVADDDGDLVTDLTQSDFLVFEDGIPQTISIFESETNLPLTIALIIDVSGSIRDKLRFEQEAAIEFFYTTIQEGRDQGMLITFDSAVDMLQDFTDNPEALSEATRLMRAGGGTALYDAIYLAVDQKLSASDREGRRVVVVISDGDDNASRVSLTETLELAQRNDVAIYTISTNSTANFVTPEQRRGDRTLETFAVETGGRAFFPFKLEELAVNFADISEELRSQYTLAYAPTNLARDGSYREIRVGTTTDDDLEVKHREGYYAPLDTAPEE
jgi:Ca-activated chloride channel family protein